MKLGLKTSLFSILTVAFAMGGTTAWAASSVRALGGSGTYDSASSAAGAKTTGGTKSTDAKGTVRAGSMRVGTAGTRTSSTRGASTTPRLSIGKYLGGATSVSGGSSVRPGQSGSGDSGAVDGKLQERVEALETFVGYSETGASIKVDVEALQADINDITGKMTVVEYKDGVLSILSDKGEVLTTANLATAADIDGLQAAIDAIVLPDVSKFLTEENLADTKAAVAALQAADTAMDSAIKALQGNMLTEDKLTDKVSELELADSQLTAAIEELKTKMPAVDGLVDKAYVDELVAELNAVDTRLGVSISAIQQAYVKGTDFDNVVAGLNTSIDSLTAADTALSGLIDDINVRLSTLSTKQELSDGLAELRAQINQITTGGVDLLNYYTIDQTKNLFLTKEDAANTYATQVSVSELDESVQKIVEVLNATRDIATDAQSAATQNAADIAEIKSAGYVKADELATVAKTGSYNDLADTPTLITQSDLDVLRSALELKIEQKQQKGEYATVEYLNQVKQTLDTLKGDTYTKAEIDQKVKEAIESGNIDLTGYATTTMLSEMGDELKLLIDNKVDKDGLGQLAYLNQVGATNIDTGDIEAGEMAMLLVDKNGQHSWVSVVVAVP